MDPRVALECVVVCVDPVCTSYGPHMAPPLCGRVWACVGVCVRVWACVCVYT